MEKLKNKTITLSASILFLFAALFAVTASFAPAVRENRLQLQRKNLTLAGFQGLIHSRQEIETQWKPLEADGLMKRHPEEVLNRWVRSLLEYGQKEGVVFQKLEPQGIKQAGKEKEISLFLLMETDIKKLIRFLHYLYEKDSFSKVGALAVKADENSKKFIIELTLVKVIL
jgi:hypothetical protein